jgi:outer membrane protein assembly factor BamB
MTIYRRVACALPLLCVLASGSASGQWSQFRGPNGSGVDSAAGYPVEFSPSKNAVWKTAVPYGQSSPVVAGGHVYLTASENTRLLTICLDARTGREAWRREIRRARSATIFRANDPASPSPAADDDGVVVFFADFGLAAYTPDGKDRWTLPLGPFRNFYGMAASPIIAGDLLIMLIDQQSGAFVLALDRKTGRQRWKTDRAGAGIGWATPMVFRPAGGAAQLIVLGSYRLDGYTLDTGAPRWWMPLASGGALGTPVSDGDTVFVSTAGSSDPVMPAFDAVLRQYDKDHDGRLSHDEFKGDADLGEHFGWIDANSDGFVTAEEWNVARALGVGEFGAIAIQPKDAHGQLDLAAVRWRVRKNLPYIPAPLQYQGVLYMVKDGGIVTALDPATGELLKQGRSPDALGEYYASPVAADNKVFLSSADGRVSVLGAGRQWELLQVNDLGEEIHATPALSGGKIYVRTRTAVYCFGAAPGRDQ